LINHNEPLLKNMFDLLDNHLLTNDSADSIDTLERAIRKLAKSRDVRGSPK